MKLKDSKDELQLKITKTEKYVEMVTDEPKTFHSGGARHDGKLNPIGIKGCQETG